MGTQEALGATATTGQLRLQLYLQPEHSLKCAWAEQGQTSSLTPSPASGPQINQQKHLTPLPAFSLDLALLFTAGLKHCGGFLS